MSRRAILKRGAVIGGALASGYLAVGQVSNLPAASRSLAGWRPAPQANEKLNIAAIGSSNRAGENIAQVASENIVALCDVDENLLEKAAANYPAARKYRDFRVLLEKEAEKIDAVLVGTPDHTHAPAAAMALRLGKHVYCEKPLSHTVVEARTLAELARKNKLVTQMGTQIHRIPKACIPTTGGGSGITGPAGWAISAAITWIWCTGR